jgi:hypothetical protein
MYLCLNIAYFRLSETKGIPLRLRKSLPRRSRREQKIQELFEKKCSRCSVFVHPDAQPMRMEHADAQPIRILDTDVQDILSGMACFLRVSQVF